AAGFEKNGPVLTKGTLDDTEYKDRPAFYLPKTTKMEVTGYMEGTLYLCDQLVLMTCEDQKVYCFDGEELHLVAFSLDQMFTVGIANPARQSYYHGEAFKDMIDYECVNIYPECQSGIPNNMFYAQTKEDWEEVAVMHIIKLLANRH
uniref:Uncharacterized protein n=1 Tax=Poecilia reticulata TaxID=8081 RepID=A0A3P9PX54_POERE